MAERLNWSEGSYYGVDVSADMFGGNLLFDRDRPDGTYGQVFSDLGLSNVRYPGGTITEWYFDIKNPNATRAWDATQQSWRELLPLTDFLTWAGQEGYGVNLVIPTAQLLTGQDGAQVPRDSAYADVKAYVLDVLNGRYGEAQIDTIELGNEYWLGAEMNIEEYARIADLMAVAVQDAIDSFRASGAAPEGWVEPDISIQVGQYGAHSTDPGWLQNAYLMDSLSDEAAAAIDAVVMHYYARGTFADLPSYEYVFDRLDSWAERERFAEIDYHITEWSTENWDTEETGLRQASVMVWMMSEMIAQGVDQAHVWPVQQNTRNDLSGDEGQDALTLAGEGMRLVAESLSGLTFERRLTFDGGVGYLFAGGDETVVFLTSRQDAEQTLQLDLADLGLGEQIVSLAQLGTSGASNNPNALPQLTLASDLALGANGLLDVTLGAYEVSRITLSSTPTSDIRGSAGGDWIVDGATAARIFGLGGNDTIDAGAGDDSIDAGLGDDRVLAGDGADLVDAGGGDDTVDGGAGTDLVTLGDGDDTYDEQTGSLGADKVFGGNGRDLIYGRGGDDGLSGDRGDDTIFGGDGRDTVLGFTGADLLYGGRDDDEMDGGSGNDEAYGGDGNDVIAGGSGHDHLLGEAGDDLLHGESGNDTLDGGDGADQLSGRGGRDVLIGGVGSDTLAGGDNDDTLDGGAGADVFVFDRDDGTDLIIGFQDQDMVDLRGQGLSFEEVTVSTADGSATAAFAGTRIVFLDLGRDLEAGDFLFV